MWKTDHNCMLVNAQQDIVIECIDSGFAIGLRRAFRRFTMIHRKHPMTMVFIRSNSAVRSEEIRHLLQYYTMIHPFSKMSLFWSFLMATVYTLMLMVVPFGLGFKGAGHYAFLALLILDVFQCVDVCLNFFVGYYDQQNSEVVLRPKKVARRYVGSYFFTDVVSTIPSYLYPLSSIISEHAMTFHVLNFLVIFKLRRLGYVQNALSMLRVYYQLPTQVTRVVNLLLLLLVVVLWVFGIGFGLYGLMSAISGKSSTDWKKGIIRGLFYTMKLLQLVGYGGSDWIFMYDELVFTISLMLIIGFLLHLYLLAKVTQIWSKYSTTINKHDYMLQQIEQYAEYKALPAHMKTEMSSYFDFKYQKQFYQESEINQLMSRQLKEEILIHAAKSHIQNVEMFFNLPRGVQVKIADQLRSQIFMPPDKIVRAGETGTSMYFVFTGTLAAYSPSGREICHLRDGDHFGDVGMIFNEPRMVTVVAVTSCELFKLRRSDFLMVMEPYTDLMEELRDYARKTLIRLRKRN